jgi:hypothetical protein
VTPDEAYGVLTAIGRLTDGLTKVEAQRDAALLELKQLQAAVEAAVEKAKPDGD